MKPRQRIFIFMKILCQFQQVTNLKDKKRADIYLNIDILPLLILYKKRFFILRYIGPFVSLVFNQLISLL